MSNVNSSLLHGISSSNGVHTNEECERYEESTIPIKELQDKLIHGLKENNLIG